MAQPISIGGKAVAIVFALVFGAAMMAVGIFGGIAPLHEQFRNWTAARAYVQVPAQVESAILDTRRSSKGAVSYHAKAEFSYTYQGLHYKSNRVSFSGMADNIGSFQQRMYSGLRAALDNGESVQLWVDPDHPATAVYDKSFRVEMLLFHLVFATMFPSVSLACLLLVYYLLRSGREKPLADLLKDGRHPLVRTKGNHYGFMMFATLHVNVLAWTIGLPAIEQFLDGRHAPAILPMLLPLAGLAMAYFSWRRWSRPRSTGKPVLEITGIAPLRGRILFHPRTGLPSPSGQPIVPVSIDAEQQRERRIGRKLEFETVWQQRVLDRSIPRGTEMLEFEVNAPHLGDKRWRITLHLDTRAVTFELPNTI